MTHRIEHGEEFPPDVDAEELKTYRLVKPFTMTSLERIVALCRSIEYIFRCNIPGHIVECGVWRGGSLMAAASTLLRVGDTSRSIYAFDTFEGMSDPTADDVDWRGQSAAALLKNRSAGDFIHAQCSLDEVRRNIRSTGVCASRLRFVQGRVEDTIPRQAPDAIALLRLDTDWYESTYHEMVHLFPRLSTGGIIIIDDYGHWAGAKKAVDQYIAERKLCLMLHRIDYTGRIAVKI